MATAEFVERALDVVLAEHASIRDEIRGRSEAQGSLMSISAAASVGLTGYVMQSGASADLLLLLPFVSAVFGLLWFDHHRSITGLGRYLRHNTRADVLAILQLADPSAAHITRRLLRWEWHVGDGRSVRASYLIPQFSVFLLPGIVGLIAGGRTTVLELGAASPWTDAYRIALFTSGLVILVWFTVLWSLAFLSGDDRTEAVASEEDRFLASVLDPVTGNDTEISGQTPSTSR